MAIEAPGFEGTEAWEPLSILSAGEHLVTVTKARDDQKTKNGFPQYELEMAGDNGGTIRAWQTVVPESYGAVAQMLEAFGLRPEGSVLPEASSLIGKRCKIMVVEEPHYSDPTKKQSKVRWFAPIEGGGQSNGSGQASLNDPSAQREDIPF